MSPEAERAALVEAVLAYRVGVWEKAKENAARDLWNRLTGKPEERKAVRPGDYKDAEDAAFARFEQQIERRVLADQPCHETQFGFHCDPLCAPCDARGEAKR